MENDKELAPLVESDVYVIRIMGVMGAIAYAFSAPPAAPIALGLAITNLFLPDIFNATKNVSTTLSNNIFAAIEDKLREAAIERADIELQKFTAQFKNFASLFNKWQNDTHLEVRNNAQKSLQDLYSHFAYLMLPELKSAFAHEKYGGFMLPQFVSVASQYLSIFKMYYAYAVPLNLPVTAAGDSDLQHRMLMQWRAALKDIVDSGVSSYRGSLQDIVQNRWTVRSWDDYNDFRNKATILGLDTLATFQYLDPVLYPRGCNVRNRSRKLLTFLDSSADESFRIKYRNSITYLDQRYNPLEEIRGLKSIQMFYAEVPYDPIFGPKKAIDSMIGVECTGVSKDGVEPSEIRFPYSGLLPKPASAKSMTAEFERPCCWVTGLHRYPGTNNLKQSAIVEIAYHLVYESYVQQYPSPYAPFVLHNARLEEHQRKQFSETLPETSSYLPQWQDVKENRQHRLVKVFVDILSEEEQHNYVFSWRHRTALDDLLPVASHQGVDIATIKTEQFHAIRATNAIHSQRLGMSAGPGFTGGDMVVLNAGQWLRWHLKRDPQRWFAGFYSVRLWCVRFDSNVDLSISVIPENGLSSKTELRIERSAGLPDIFALKFADLEPVDFPSSLLLTSSMNAVAIEVRNQSLTGFIMIDRVEFAFDKFASLEGS